MKKLIPYGLFAGAIGFVAVVFFIDTLDMTKAAYELPRILIVLVLFLLVLMLVERYYLLGRPTPLTDGPDEGLAAALPAEGGEVSVSRIAVFVTLLVTYVVIIKPLGYFLATPLFLLAVFSYLRATKMVWIVLISVGFTVFVYLLFVLFLNLPVPMGIMAQD